MSQVPSPLNITGHSYGNLDAVESVNFGDYEHSQLPTVCRTGNSSHLRPDRFRQPGVDLHEGNPEHGR